MSFCVDVNGNSKYQYCVVLIEANYNVLINSSLFFSDSMLSSQSFFPGAVVYTTEMLRCQSDIIMLLNLLEKRIVSWKQHMCKHRWEEASPIFTVMFGKHSQVFLLSFFFLQFTLMFNTLIYVVLRNENL